MLSFKLTASILALIVSINHVRAFSTGPPNCPRGESAPGPAHRPAAAGFTEDSIPAGGFSVTIGSEALVLGTPLDVVVGETYEVTISRDAPFRGVLAILNGGDADLDATSIVSIADGDANLQISTPCTSLALGGVTHSNGNDKTSVTFFVTFDAASDNITLDLNVVQARTPASVFFYSQFTMNAVVPPAPTGTPTSTPTGTPTPPPPPPGEITIYEFVRQEELRQTGQNVLSGLAIRAVPDVDNPNATLTFFSFAPSAILGLPQQLTVRILSDPALADNLIKGIILPEAYNASQLTALSGQELTFLSGDVQPITTSTDGELFVGPAKVITADVYEASNGWVHIVDRIIGIPTISEAVLQGGNSLVALGAAIASSGLAETIDGLSGVTVMAPSTTGFLGLAANFMELSIAFQTNPAWNLHTVGLLLAHVFPQVVFSSTLSNGATLTALSGDVFTVAISSGTVTLAPGSGPGAVATVVAADTITTQGIVHVIDAVLLPSFVGKTVVDVVLEKASTLASLVVAADLDELLATTFGLTIFAPTNEAFQKLDPAAVAFLQSDAGKDDLSAVLQYHVVRQVIPSTAVAPGTITVFSGESLEITVVGQAVMVGAAKIVGTDFLANNGIVHTIDTVLGVASIDLPTTPTDTPTTMPAGVPSPSLAPILTVVMSLFGTIFALAGMMM